MDENHKTVLSEKGRVTASSAVPYIDHCFLVPEGATRVSATLRFDRGEGPPVYLALFDPRSFRGSRMPQGWTAGEMELHLWVGLDDAGPGGLPGPMPAGLWRAQIDVPHLGSELSYSLEVAYELGAQVEPHVLDFPEGYVSKAKPGWYKGELHAHSWESDGKCSAEDVVAAARECGLDFFALTDHYTVSGWRFLKEALGPEMALIRAQEITAHGGHANLFGIKQWVNCFVDGDGWNMTDAMREVHAQGGLFCVCHPFSNELGWQYHDFAWDELDLIEIYHNLEGPNNWLGLSLWDHHLNLGRRIIGVGATDSHHPAEGRHALGQLVTWVYALELSEGGILEGLRSGRVYASRGPAIEFTAHSAGEPEGMVYMGSSLPLGRPIEFRVQVREVKEPMRLFIIKNGLYYGKRELSEAGKDYDIEFTDTPVEPAYYRLELHVDCEDKWYRLFKFRSYTTVRALSNPVFVGGWPQEK